MEINKKIGILYSTTDGHTYKISRKIAEHIEGFGFKVDIVEISTFTKSIFEYSILIIGASIRYGKHSKIVTQFIKNNHKELVQIETAFFSVNLVARKVEKSTFDTNPYVIKFFKHLDWKPTIIDVFAGRLDYNSYSFVDRIMIKLIMKMTKGPTKSDRPIEYTDWDRVKSFSLKICGN